MASTLELLAKESANLEYLQENDETKSQYWLKMGAILESNNYPKEKIARQVRRLIEEQLKEIYKVHSLDTKEAKLKSGHYYRTMSKAGFTDPAFDHRSLENVTEGERNNSSKVSDEKPYAEYRNQLIEYHHNIIQEAENNIAELLIDDVVIEAKLNDKENNVKKGDKIKMSRDWANFFDEQSTEFFKLFSDMFYNDRDNWNKQRDERYSLLPHMRLPIFSFISLVLPKHFCTRYFSHVKKATTITTKKFKQFVKDVNPNGTVSFGISDLLNLVKEDAWKWNFIDIACPDCKEKSLKVKLLGDGTWRFICKNKKAHSKEILYSSTLLNQELEKLETQKKEGTKFLNEKSISIPTQ